MEGNNVYWGVGGGALMLSSLNTKKFLEKASRAKGLLRCCYNYSKKRNKLLNVDDFLLQCLIGSISFCLALAIAITIWHR